MKIFTGLKYYFVLVFIQISNIFTGHTQVFSHHYLRTGGFCIDYNSEVTHTQNIHLWTEKSVLTGNSEYIM